MFNLLVPVYVYPIISFTALIWSSSAMSGINPKDRYFSVVYFTGNILVATYIIVFSSQGGEVRLPL